jgi:ABC-type multidrug transport system fused ATPase/permease subunit
LTIQKINYSEYLREVLVVLGSRKKFIPLLFLGFIITAFLDLFGIGIVGPFIGMFLAPEQFTQRFEWLQDVNFQVVMISASVLLVLIFLSRAILGYFVQSFILRIAFGRQAELRKDLTTAYLKGEYTQRLKKNSADYNRTIIFFCDNFIEVLISMLRISADLLTLLGLACLLIYTNFLLFLLCLIMVVTFFTIYSSIYANKFVKLGVIKNKGIHDFSQALNEAIKGLKEIKVLNVVNFFEERVHEGAKNAAEANKTLWLFNVVPRYFIELLLAIIVAAIIMIAVIFEYDTIAVVSSLGIFLIASLKILPSINSIISAFNKINSGRNAVHHLYDDLIQIKDINIPEELVQSDIKKDELNSFKLELRDINFKYPGTEINVLNKLNLTISQGEFLGISGRSGEGKTTLIDLILGIHRPSSGSITFNDKNIYEDLGNWRKNIAYLPQETFLLEATIKENVAIGMKNDGFDDSKIILALEKAGLLSFIEQLPEGINSNIGEGGLFISGGQKQRISLARAFFQEKNIFIFDESTSNLDEDSEQRVMETIFGLVGQKNTLIMISHKPSILEQCSTIYILDKGRLTQK